ncbi:unnamed protein product [Clonostachys solani]|uniref:Uncharacterized protein n=1 Tax=Clonostachys solani TaxID=160281 RepID=A0A9N9W5U3_9HYPO|nr:unnamed protein product [Clonostachys solani]
MVTIKDAEDDILKLAKTHLQEAGMQELINFRGLDCWNGGRLELPLLASEPTELNKGLSKFRGNTITRKLMALEQEEPDRDGRRSVN